MASTNVTDAHPSATNEITTGESQIDHLLFPLETLYDPSPVQPIVDIVAIHGLSEDHNETWTLHGSRETPKRPGSRDVHPFIPERFWRSPNSLLPKKGPAQTDTQSIETAPDPPQESPNKEVNWLKDSDMLPAAHPEARIMTFGYPRTLERTDVSPADGLFLVAKALLQQLGKIRSPHSCNSRRPIIFIGHSFGGIVIEKALVLAASDGHSEISEDNDILKSTVGVIFLSTPFQGFRIHPASPGNSNRVALLSGSPRLSVDSRATEMSAQSHSGEAVASSSATARGDSWPRVVGSHGSAIPVVAESNSPHHRSLASLLNTEYGHKTLNDLFHNFIETVQTQHIRMACFVNGPLPKLTETRLQSIQKFPRPCKSAGMSKYSGPYDVNYKCVLNILKVFCNFASTQQLWKAIASCDDSAVRTLLEIGADPDLKNLAGRSALHLAAEAKSKSITKLLLDEARIIDVNSKDIEDKTALDYAVSNGSEGIVGLLLGRGAETPDLQAGDTTDETTTDSLKALLNKPALLSGPTLNRNPSLLQKSGDHLSPACRRACKDFEVTKTTFYLIKEHNKSSDKTAGKNPVHNANNDTKPNMGADKNTEKRPDKTKDSDFEKIKKGVNKPSKSYNWIAETEPKEWRLSQTSTIYETLYPETEGPELPPESVTSQYNKPAPSVTWKWYHFPANNMAWIETFFANHMRIDNIDKLMTGQEHRGGTMHSRFLKPQAKFIKRRRSGEDCDVVMLFMPYLHTETTSIQRRMSKVTEQAWNDLETENNTHQNELPLVIVNLCTAIDVNSIEPSDSGGDVLRCTLSGTSESLALQQEQDMISIDGNLINAYLGQGPLHIRRTLDQFYYLGMASTKERDGDQVVAKRPLTELLAEELDKSTKSKKPAPADSRQETKPASNQKIIMVDQLWLWIVDQDTVITSFPQRWSGLDASNDVIDGVLQSVQNHLKSPHRHALKSVYDLASLIINNCTSAFESFRASGNHQYLDVFDNSICDISNEELKLSRKYHQLTTKLKDDKDDEHRTSNIKTLFDITQEVFLLSLIRDIQDELNILDHVLGDQHDALVQLLGKKKGVQESIQRDHTQFKNYIHNNRLDKASVIGPTDANRKAVHKMQRDAQKVYNDVSRLLDLKQKYANACEARYSREQSQTAAQQGKTIVVFTIVTIVFLPLSFMATFLTLNIQEFPKPLHAGWISGLIFGVSMAFIIPLILVAIYVNQLKHWIQHTLADCVGLVRHWIRMFRDGCTLLQQWMRIRRRYAARDLETGDTLEYGTEKGSGPIFTSATEDAAERVEPVQRRRLIG